MRTLPCLLIALLVSACVPEYVLPPTPVAPEQPPVAEKVLLPPEPMIASLYTNVWQTRGSEHILWGYDQHGRLLLLNSSNNTITLHYHDDKLMRIDDGIKPLVFTYNEGRLVKAQRGLEQWAFTYTSTGLLRSMDDDEKLTLTHDHRGRLSSAQRGIGTRAEFSYDEQNRTKSMYKGAIQTEMVYDDRGRLTRMDRRDDHLVLGYWRHNLLSSLSGIMYGLKETVNYGPTSVTLVSNVEQNVFESAYPDEEAVRLHAFNMFLFCTRFRKLPVLFDGQSWVLYHEYMKGNITEYVFTTFLCEYVP